MAIVDSMEKAVFGHAGKQVLIEQFLQGEELTIMAFTDGRTVAPMLPAQDHKRIGDGDTGLNTGGMGAYCPAPLGTSALACPGDAGRSATDRRRHVAVGFALSRSVVCRVDDCPRTSPTCWSSTPAWAILKRRSCCRC